MVAYRKIAHEGIRLQVPGLRGYLRPERSEYPSLPFTRRPRPDASLEPHHQHAAGDDQGDAEHLEQPDVRAVAEDAEGVEEQAGDEGGGGGEGEGTGDALGGGDGD